MIPADLLAHELKRHGDLYGTCLIAPEKNTESGGSCLTTLKMICPADHIYRQVPHDRIADKPSASGELGWETNHATKYTILNDLRAAVEDSLLIISDPRILKEMRSFTHSDANETWLKPPGTFDKALRPPHGLHDRLGDAQVPRVREVATDYQQPEYEKPGV